MKIHSPIGIKIYIAVLNISLNGTKCTLYRNLFDSSITSITFFGYDADSEKSYELQYEDWIHENCKIAKLSPLTH